MRRQRRAKQRQRRHGAVRRLARKGRTIAGVVKDDAGNPVAARLTVSYSDWIPLASGGFSIKLRETSEITAKGDGTFSVKSNPATKESIRVDVVADAALGVSGGAFAQAEVSRQLVVRIAKLGGGVVRFTVTGTRHRPLKVYVLDSSGYELSGIKPKNVNGRGQATFDLAQPAGRLQTDVLRRRGRQPQRPLLVPEPGAVPALSMSGFRGFPPDALTFLRELEDNNDRDWFKANRRRYDELLVVPVRALGEELEAAGFGRARMFRPWNDTRFRPGPPIKEHVGLAVGYEGSGGFYVELSLDGLFVAAGLHNPAPDQVERMRRLVADGRTPRR